MSFYFNDKTKLMEYLCHNRYFCEVQEKNEKITFGENIETISQGLKLCTSSNPLRTLILCQPLYTFFLVLYSMTEQYKMCLINLFYNFV